MHEAYVRVCKQQQVSGHADLSEFKSMCMLSEAKGIVALKKAKDPRSAKVCMPTCSFIERAVLLCCTITIVLLEVRIFC